MKRTPLARGDSQLRRTGPPNPVSEKRRGEAAARREVREETHRRAGFRCELRTVVPEVVCWHPAGEPLDVDEIAQRGVAPGGHLDVENTQAVCRAHHDWKTEHRDEAIARGVRMTGEEYRRQRDAR